MLAAAIKDNARGALVSQKTSSTASEQKFIELADGSALAITHVRYPPAGRPIMRTRSPPWRESSPSSSRPADTHYRFISTTRWPRDRMPTLYRKYIDTVYAKQLEKALEVLKQGRQPSRWQPSPAGRPAHPSETA